MRRALSLAALALVLAVAPAAAQDALPTSPRDSLSLLDVVRLALAERPALAAAAAERDVAGAERDRAASEWWPQLSVQAGLTRFEEPMLVTPLHSIDVSAIEFDRTLMDATLGGRWTLYEGGARRARGRSAEAGLRAAEAGLEAAADATIVLAVTLYADVLAARETLSAHDLRLRAIDAERERVARALAEGAAAGVELARARAAAAGARADRVAAAAGLELAEGELARLTGLSSVALAGRLTDVALSFDPRAPADSVASPVVERARWEARAAAAAADAMRASWWPALETRGAWIQRGGADVEEATGEWQLGLQLDWALFTGGERTAAISRAEAERRVAEERLAQTELDRESEIDRARTGIARARARSDALAEAVAAQAEVARVERLALDVGAGVQSDWLDAEADLLTARASLVRARADALVAAVELARATGALDVDWLAQRLEGSP